MTIEHRPTLDVEQMILQEDDPKVRSHLVLMLQLVTTVKGLAGNVESMASAQRSQAEQIELQLSDVKNTMDTHVEMLAKARGAGWITTKVMPVVMACVAGFSGYVWNEARSLQGNIVAHGVTDSALRAEMANHQNVGAMSDLRLANRMDILDERLKRIEESLRGRAGK